MFRFSDIYSTGSTGLGRSLIAFVVAPLFSSLIVVSGVVAFLVLDIPLESGPPGIGAAPGILQMIWGFAAAVLLGTLVIGGPVTYIGMALIGFPTWLLLRYTNNESAAAYAGMGALGGSWLGPALGGHKWEAFPLAWIGGCGGALALFLFWGIARRR